MTKLKDIRGGSTDSNYPWVQVNFENGDSYTLTIQTKNSKKSVIHLFEKLIQMMKGKEN
ncbi:MAG: hypothetical protein GY714_20130 [Desulfobacterales bacterium]|nr:hypothetical protein [Desulfobacterales bacterium]